VEAVQRFKIQKVIMSHEDQIIKVCEVTLIDDEAEFKKLDICEKRHSLINKVKENSYKLI
jgi:hypothetical protein